MDEWIALGSLIVAAISLVTGYVQRGKSATARDQRIEDKLDNQSSLVREMKTTLDKLDGKTDDHSERIAKIEIEQSNIHRRLDRLDDRCERHFGPSQYEA